jgi:predicted PhzF superfamily epimerase YddE/YHI9
MQLTVVDAFTDVPFRGNPAAVCLLPEPAPDEWMQQVARELNLSETAFLVKRPDGFDLRWFTPAVEVALCGHATLASAHALGESSLQFFTQSGVLSATRLEDDWIRLDFPATPPDPVEPPAGLLAALGCEARWLGKSRFDYFVEVESEAVVRALDPDHSALRKLPVRDGDGPGLGRI